MMTNLLAERNKKIGLANRKAILKFAKSRPFCTQNEVAAALGMNVFVVGRHVKKIREEWRNGKKP
jgi:uncharacterized protein with HEPN domain